MGPICVGQMEQKWGTCQYVYAKGYQLIEASQNWQVGFIRALANASFRLWENCNGCQHGINNATKTQAQSDQTQCKIRCLYELHEIVLPQNCLIFLQSVEQHLQKHKHSNAHGSGTINRSLLTPHALLQSKRDYRSNSCGNFSLFAGKTFLTLRTKKSTETPRFNTMRIASHFATQPSHGRQQRNPKPRKKPNDTILQLCQASIIQLGCQYPNYPSSKRTRHPSQHHHNAD
jgi:hypothetical protein